MHSFPFVVVLTTCALLLLTRAEDQQPINGTTEIGTSRNDRQGLPGGQGLQAVQQGIKGIQNIQKLVSRLSSMVRLPFSFRGVSDTMATLTGVLAAVGGGYLTYVGMVALFDNMLAGQADPGYYGPAQQLPYRRSGSNLYLGSLDLGKVINSIRTFDFPEASFTMLRIKDDACKHRTVCEFEKFLAKKGIASVILKGVSRKIPGMEKYLDAAYRGLANEDCSYAFASCPYSLGQKLLRSIGLS